MAGADAGLSPPKRTGIREIDNRSRYASLQATFSAPEAVNQSMTRAAQTRLEFEAFVERSTGELLRTVYLITGDLGEAEDIVQETLVRLAHRWRRVRGMEHPLAYARRAAVNIALDGGPRRARRRAELQSAPDHDGSVQPGGPHRLELHADLLDALGSLPARQRAVIVLRYYADLTEKDVAETLGCSLGTVKSSASRALARLETQLRPRTSRLSHREQNRSSA